MNAAGGDSLARASLADQEDVGVARREAVDLTHDLLDLGSSKTIALAAMMRRLVRRAGEHDELSSAGALRHSGQQ